MLSLFALGVSTATLAQTDQKQVVRDTDIVATEPGEWRQKESEQQGFGFGVYKTLLRGYELFYDYQLKPELLDKYGFGDKQMSIHAYYSWYEQEAIGILFNDYFVKTSSTHLGATIRYFPSAQYGWYYGGGSSLVSAKQETSIPEYCSSLLKEENHKDCGDQTLKWITVKNSSSFSGLSFYGEAGWQGYDGYYFTIGLRLGISLALSEDNNTADVPSESSTAKKQWKEAKDPGAVIMLFGWHF